MDYTFQGEFSLVPDAETRPDEILVYNLNVYLEGRLQFRVKVLATPAEILGNAHLGGSSYEQYPEIEDDYHALAESAARQQLRRWQPVPEHERRVTLFTVKFNSSREGEEERSEASR